MEQFGIAQNRLFEKYGLVARSGFLNLPGLSIRAHVIDAGKGSPIVILHGGGAYACQFTSLIHDLSDDYHVIVPDRPGCGLTDPFDYSGVDLRQHAVNFIGGILDALNLDSVYLIGNSMGGYWALLFSLAYPDRVKKLILVGEPAGSTPPALRHPIPPANENPTMESVKGLYTFMLVANSELVPDELYYAEIAAAKIPGAASCWNSLLDQFRHHPELGSYDLRKNLSVLQTETLFIWGNQDRFGPPELGVEMVDLMPHAKLEKVEKAGHLVWIDQPEKCVTMIRNFLK